MGSVTSCCTGDVTQERDEFGLETTAEAYFDEHCRDDVERIERKTEAKILHFVPPEYIATFKSILEDDFPSCILRIENETKDGKTLIIIQNHLRMQTSDSLIDVLGMHSTAPSYEDAMKAVQSKYRVKKVPDSAGGATDSSVSVGDSPPKTEKDAGLMAI